MKVTIHIRKDVIAEQNRQPKAVDVKSIQSYEEEILFQYFKTIDDVRELCKCFSEKAQSHIFVDKYNRSVEIPIKYFTFIAE